MGSEEGAVISVFIVFVPFLVVFTSLFVVLIVDAFVTIEELSVVSVMDGSAISLLSSSLITPPFLFHHVAACS